MADDKGAPIVKAKYTGPKEFTFDRAAGKAALAKMSSSGIKALNQRELVLALAERHAQLAEAEGRSMAYMEHSPAQPTQSPPNVPVNVQTGPHGGRYTVMPGGHRKYVK